jgi:hypothetical protein
VEAHAAMPHFSDAELGRMERLRKAGDVPQMILHKVQRTRRLRGVAGPTQSAVYRYLAGETYERDARLLYAVPFVVTINFSTANMQLLDTHDWLGHPDNRVLLVLSAQAFVHEEFE